MAYGFECRRADGVVQLSSEDFGMVLNEVAYVSAGAGSVVFQYPAYVGRAAYCIPLALTQFGFLASPTITYPGGVPTLTFPRQGGDYVGMVFIS